MELNSEAMTSLNKFIDALKDVIKDKAEELAREKNKNMIDDDILQKAILIVLMKKGTMILDMVLEKKEK